jgi:hypothetical protein
MMHSPSDKRKEKKKSAKRKWTCDVLENLPSIRVPRLGTAEKSYKKCNRAKAK